MAKVGTLGVAVRPVSNRPTSSRYGGKIAVYSLGVDYLCSAQDFARVRLVTMEELVTELGSAFLCGDLGFSSKPRLAHAWYLAHWLKALEDDNPAIFTAASTATKTPIFYLTSNDIKGELRPMACLGGHLLLT